MIKELCVVGHPSFVGGADTELLDQIKCWSKMGIKIYICHTGPIVPYFKTMNLSEKYGCIYLRPRHWNDVTGFHCISFCNGEYLSNIQHIKKYARSTSFVNCMTWNFEKEVKAQSEGWIDFHLYQTDHGMMRISRNLHHLGKYKALRFDPYFDTSAFPFHKNRPNDHFRFGRISRCDLAKYAEDQFNIYDRFQSPVPKSGVILGWGERVRAKYNLSHKDLKRTPKRSEIYKDYIELFREGVITQQNFYKFCDVLIMSTETYENLPRVGFECMSSGSVMIVNDRGGWKLQVNDGETGYLCNKTSDFIEKATLLANNPSLKEDLRLKAREKLDNEWGLERAMKSWDLVFKEWEKYDQNG
jgi:glycosyltransferase involved in cell wall biosynthesis